MKLRVVAADDNSTFLSELRSLLERHFDVVATALDGTSALDSIRRHMPDVAILDLTMPGLNGMEVTRILKDSDGRPAVLICSVETDPDILGAAREAGAEGYVFKERVTEDLISAVKAVARGQMFSSDKAVR